MTGGVRTTRGIGSARNKRYSTPTIATDVDNSTPINMEGSCSCSLYMEDGDVTEVAVYARVDGLFAAGEEVYKVLRDTNGTAVTVAIDPGAFQSLGNFLYPVTSIKLQANDAVSGVVVAVVSS